jgi:hypothetical protein
MLMRGNDMFLFARVPKGYWQILVKLSCLILLIIAINFVADWVVGILKIELRPSNEELIHKTIMVSSIIFGLLVAIPFVPGVELGITLIAMFGPPIVFLVYLSTLIGLSISFIIGRLISLRSLVTLFENLKLKRSSQLLNKVEPLKMEDRLEFLISQAPSRLVPFLIRHRYIALAILVNLPGNILIGGGGGISLIAGASRLFSLPGFLITIALAVSPVPLAILIFGKEILQR